MKSSLIDISEKVILLADSSKIGKRALTAFADFESINIFMTDSGADSYFIDHLRSKNIEVIVVEKPE